MRLVAESPLTLQAKMFKILYNLAKLWAKTKWERAVCVAKNVHS